MNKKLIILMGIIVLMPLISVIGDWVSEDGHKMHYPQLPDETGWAVNATMPLILADDWMCTETGWVKDVHFWGAWRNGVEGIVDSFVLSIHSDIPADQSPTGYSMPGVTLKEIMIRDFVVTPPIDPPTLEGWYDPMTNEIIPDDHQPYYQYNVFLPEADWFWQDSGTIYWLNISVFVTDPTGGNVTWGWKSTKDHWNDDAVWATWGNLDWREMYEPDVLGPVHNDFYITLDPSGNFVQGGGTNYYGQGWYFYPQEAWWNIWFYDHPFAPERFKQVHIEYDIFPFDPGLPSFVEIAVNFSTDQWSYDQPPLDSFPPLPGENEQVYIGRHIIYSGEVVPGHYIYDWEWLNYNPEWVSIDVRGNNFYIPFGFIDHECIGQQSLDLSFVITGGKDSDTCDFYKLQYNDYAPQGMPDFDQKQGGWQNPTNGFWTYCGPVAVANCLWWFDSKFEPNPVDPRPFGGAAPNDGFNLLTPYGMWDDHDPNNVQPFVNDLATLMNTNSGPGGAGTWFQDMVDGTRQYIQNKGLDYFFKDSIQPIPSYEFISQQVRESQDVILLLGFYEDYGTHLCWIGGHYVTVAGVCTSARQICISDPYFDMLEGNPPGAPPHSGIIHNDADNISGPHSQIQHDPYSLISFIPPGATYPVEELQSYTLTLTNLVQFMGQNNPGIDPCGTYNGGPVRTVIDFAYVICPDTAIDTCDYYKAPYDDYSPQGMPDFDQKQDNWVGQQTGNWSYCGPVALANCFWWFDSKFEPNPVDPRPFGGGPLNDGYPLVPSFDPTGLLDDHDTANVMPLVDSLAVYCGTNSVTDGTMIYDLDLGARNWLAKTGLSGSYSVNLYPVEPGVFGFEDIRAQVLESQDVILLLGFWEEMAPGYCERIGGHYVTVAGTCTDPADSALCISDPYFDRHEGEPPAGSAHSSDVHNDADNISGPHGTMYHDRYNVVPITCQTMNPPPTFQIELSAYPVNPGNVIQFFGQNVYDPTIDPIPPQGGQIHTVIEWALVICPVDTCANQKPGDVNSDGLIDISDVLYLVNYLYGTGPVPPIPANADVNGDCCVDFNDVIYLLNYLMHSGPAPVVCTCVNPPICVPDPPDHFHGKVKHNDDLYIPANGDPTGSAWTELWWNFKYEWDLTTWKDNGDGYLSFCDTLVFDNHWLPSQRIKEHVEQVTSTLTLLKSGTNDTLYVDMINPPVPYMNPRIITNPIGTYWNNAVIPNYGTKYVVVWWNNYSNPSLAVGDNLILQTLNGSDSTLTFNYSVIDIATDIITWPVPVPGDEYDHNLDGWNPEMLADVVGTLWKELWPNFNKIFRVDDWRDNGNNYFDFCDTIKVTNIDSPDEVIWKHIEEVTVTYKVIDPQYPDDTLFFDYMCGNPSAHPVNLPMLTFWHSIYPTFSKRYILVNWVDNGSEYMDFCDMITLMSVDPPDSGALYTYHIEGYGTDIISTIIDSPSCCRYRGDVDHMDGALPINISDLTYLVAYMFQSGPPPPCPEEGDVNDDSTIGISDITFLVDYMFGGGPAPNPCH